MRHDIVVLGTAKPSVRLALRLGLECHWRNLGQIFKKLDIDP